jgi:iron complex outermembrane receptor protein
LPNRSLRSRRAFFLAGVGCSSLIVATLPSEALAQTADQATQNAQNTQATDTGPGDVNAPQPKDQGAIVVTGIRASLRNSIQIKRSERGVVEAVSAEEIGKLPDVSIAESIARLPGLAAQRVGGRAQIISIRGFSPDFSTVLLNGRQQASSGYNRAVEFDQYPSELLGAVVVYKTPDASISGQGLAGTVDLRTVRPLAYGKRAIALNLRGEYDEGGGRNAEMSKYGWRGSASYIDQNEDGTLGWSIGYAHLDAPGHTDHTKNWFYDNYAGLLPAGSPYILSGQEAIATTTRDIRDGVMGTLEWKPSDRVHSVLDLYYSRFKQHTINRGAEWFSDAWVDDTTYSNLQSVTRGGNQFAVSGHVDNVIPILMFQDNKRTDHLFSAGLNNEFKLAEHTHLYTDLSYSSNKRDETYIEAYGGYGTGPSETHSAFDSYDFQVPANDFPQFTGFGLNYADANQVSLGDRAPWGGWGHDGLKKSPHIKETLASGDLTLKQDLGGGFFSSVEAGVNYTHRHKHKTVDELDLFLKNDRDQVLVDPRYLTDPTSLSFAGMGDVLGVRIADALNNYYDAVQLQDANHFDKSWDIKEDITTLKAKANIDSGNLHGNIGLQVVRQKQGSAGLRINTAVSPIQLVQVDVKKSYTDVLPSLNLFYDLDNHNRLRFDVAKVMMRPRMDDMRANMVPSFNGSVCAGSPGCVPGQEVHPWSASGGNPNLEPWRAKEVDVAYEWYGGKATYFSINGFYYWLDNYIYDQALTADFSGLTPPPADLAAIPSNVVISPIGQLTAPANGQGGWVRGIEVSGAFEFGRLTKLLDGFGAQGSVSYSGYRLKPDASGAIGTLPGFSPWVYNITGYYEKNGFQARASYRYRSAFKGEVIALFTNLGFPQILADKQLDAQIGYTFQESSRLNGLGILLQVSNVLNSPYRTSYLVNGTQTLETFEKYGRRWLLGASYHF